MSFTTKVKNEIITTSFAETELLACLSGYLRNSIEIQKEQVFIYSENNALVQFLYHSLETRVEFPISITEKENRNFSKNPLKVISFPKNESFLEKIGYSKENCYLPVVPSYLVDGNAEIRAYLKGVFLAKGSCNDPKTSRYHMEILLEHAEEAIFVQKLLNLFDFNAKLLNREKGYMVYLKEAETISDFLKVMGVNQAVLYFENVRIYRNQKNYTNRLNNCEQANMDKVIETAMGQLKDMEIIRSHMGFDLLDEKTKEVFFYREKYKEASLKELAEIISFETGKKITKSGLNHRFRKIKELAEKLVSIEKKEEDRK